MITGIFNLLHACFSYGELGFLPNLHFHHNDYILNASVADLAVILAILYASSFLGFITIYVHNDYIYLIFYNWVEACEQES